MPNARPRSRAYAAPVLAAALLALVLAAAAPAVAQSQKLSVGVAGVEPLVLDAGPSERDSIYDGLAVQLWQAMAQRADLTYDYRPVERDEGQGMLNDGALDVYLTATPNTGSLDTTSHSPIYFSSNLAVARRSDQSILGVVKRFFSPAFFKILLGLSVLLLIVGTVIYLVERRPNEDQFGGKPAEGIGAGFWWAGVTLTTIGYGDKAPVSFGGRAVAMLWMIVGLAVSASLTAAIVSLVSEDAAAINLPGDLRGGRVVIVEGHELAGFLERQGLPFATVPDLAAGFARVEDAETADYLVANEMELQHHARERSSGLAVQSSRLEPNYFAIGFRPGLPQADTLSRLVIDVTESAAWTRWLEQYAPR